MDPMISARKVVCYLLATATHTVDKAVVPDKGLPGNRRSVSFVQGGLNNAWKALANRNGFSRSVTKPAAMRAIVRAAMVQLANGRCNQARRLAGLLPSDDALEQTMKRIAQRHFGLVYVALD